MSSQVGKDIELAECVCMVALDAVPEQSWFFLLLRLFFILAGDWRTSRHFFSHG